MASVKHLCCVRIQAVCMTAHMMLISELLPIGSLLDYVRGHRCELSSTTLLLWAKQIAEVCILAGHIIKLLTLVCLQQPKIIEYYKKIDFNV